MNKIILLGQKFNRLLVIDEELDKNCTDAVWKCRCDCGNQTSVRASKLKTGTTKSCGCYSKELFIEAGIKYAKSEKGRLCLSLRNKSRLGPLSPNWKGGKEQDNIRLRRSQEAMEWRREVYKRDNHICQKCKIPGKRLNAHHIKPWSLFPELRYDLNNGITVCKECHIELHKIHGNPKRK